jgi:hypothetical protein
MNLEFGAGGVHFGEWTGDRPDHGHKTERYVMLFAKPLHVTVEEALLSEVKIYILKSWL